MFSYDAVMKTALCVFFWLLASCALARAAAGEALVLQDFEEGYPAGSGTSLSTVWKASGKHSLKLEPKSAAYIRELKAKDWSQYNELRISFHNPSSEPAPIIFELCDDLGQGSYWDRHQNNYTTQPGDQTLRVYYSGGVWRSESSLQFRNKKDPFDFSKMAWVSITQTASKEPLYIDKIEIVKIPELKLKDAYAFDFGRNGSPIMPHFHSINPDTVYSKEKGFGMLASGGRVLTTSMTYPTSLLGDGIAWPADGFRVDLPGGDYIAWIAFERGGFWEGEAAQYEKAILKLNGEIVHQHTAKPADPHFLFEDTEITSLTEIADKLVWPAHAIATFPIKAAAGANIFTLTIEKSMRFPLRVAGLIVAPATAEGKEFLRKHEQLQREAIVDCYPPRDFSRKGAGRRAIAAGLEYEWLEPGDNVYPGDWPSEAAGKPLPEFRAITGQTLTIHLGLYAKTDGSVSASATPLAVGATALPALISHGRYMPNRPPRMGSAWIDINHYRPEATFQIGPNLTRSLLVEFKIPADAAAGSYTSTIKVDGAGGSLRIPVKVNVTAAKLAELPIFCAFFMSGAPVQKDTVGEEMFWRLQEDMVKEQMSHGMTGLTSGVAYQFKDGKLNADDVIRLVRLAEKYGTVRGILNYGGFVNIPWPELPAFAKALSELRKSQELPDHYLTCYDEPCLKPELERAIDTVKKLKAMGLKSWGCTSVHDDPLWHELARNTDVPALALHKASDLRRLKEIGCRPWIYNNSSTRYSSGLHLWRGIQAGAEGRCEYAANNMCGYAFHNLDGREPAISYFAVHSKYGTLKTPQWLSFREGVLDVRIRLTLEKFAKPGDPALGVWTIVPDELYFKDDAQWPAPVLHKARETMIARIGELANPATR